MRVSDFMIPAKNVLTIGPTDTIRKAMDLMLEHHVGAVVVLVTGTFNIPIGIITKTDLVQAYHDNLTLDHLVKEIMSKDLLTCLESMSRDQAAAILEENENHHAIVVDDNNHFKGLVTSWDITTECAKEDRNKNTKTWPWNRSNVDEVAGSPTSTMLHPNSHPAARRPQMGDSFRDYIDHLGYFD